MKRYIYSATSARPDVFKLDTDTSYYNNFLNEKDLAYMQKAKNRTADIKLMTPSDYYYECATKIFDSTTVAALKAQRSSNSDFIKKYKKNMLEGDKFPLCYLNYADKSQEGLHRMMAVGEAFGWDVEVPVLCVYAFDAEREAANKRFERLRNFERYEMRKICEDAESNLSDWSSPVPENIEDLFTSEVEKIAKQQGYSIEVFTEVNDEGKICCYLTSFDGEVVDEANDNARAWLEDMFNTRYSEDDETIDDDDIDWNLFTL